MADILTRNQSFDSPQDALAHHGVKGMKWGVRKEDHLKGRDSGNSSKQINEEKAAKNEKRAADAQKLIDEIRAKPSRWSYVQNQKNARVSELEVYRDQRLKDARDIRDGRMTDGQRQALKGAVIAGSLVAAYGAYKYVDSGMYNQHKIQAGELVGDKFSFNRNERLARKGMTENELWMDVAMKVNPDYGETGTKMNCRRCTFAYEMRRRGYDVEATRSISATGQTVGGLLNAIDPNSSVKTGRWTMTASIMKDELRGKTSPILDALDHGGGAWGKNLIADNATFALKSGEEKASSILSALSQHPEGARGELGVGWTFGGGHSMAWEVVGGKPVIFDCQTGSVYNSKESFAKFAENITESGFTRLDKLQLNDQYLRRWVQNAR